MNSLLNATCNADAVYIDSDGLAPIALPEANVCNIDVRSDTGVSTRNVLTSTRHWYALRTTYGREKKAYDFITTHNGIAYLPTLVVEKLVNGQKKLKQVSRIPNIFFAFGTEDEIKSFVFDNCNLPFLRFYCKHIIRGGRIEKIPLIVPDYQIRSLQIICDSEKNKDVFVLEGANQKFLKGEKVKVHEGQFKGVEGIVARFRGQQRVGIVIDGIITAITAYIPTAFLRKI